MTATSETSRPLSAFDAQFLAAEAGNMTSNYCALAVFARDAEGRSLTRQRVHDLVAARIGGVAALRWRLRSMPLGLDHPEFVDGPMDLDEHIVSRTVEAPGGDRELAALAARLLATKLDRRRPLWQFSVVEGLSEGRTAVAMVFHHAAADALAFATILQLLLDTDPDAAGRPLPAAVPYAAPHGTRRVLARTLRRAATHPVRAVRAGGKALPYLDQVPMMRSLPGVRLAARAAQRVRGGGPDEMPRAPRTRFNNALSPGRSVAFGHVPVGVVRDIKAAHGVTFNDVVVAAVGGGLRRLLEAGDDLPERPLLAFVPSNVRTEHNDGRIANAISSFVVPVPTHEADPQQRIAAAQREMRAAKARHAHAPATLLEDANELIFPVVFAPLAGGILRLLGSGAVAPPLNMVLSNVPGPPVPLYLDGAPMEHVAPLSLVFDGVTLNVTVVSCAGRLEIGVVADRDATDDAWTLVREIEQELLDLQAAL